MYQILPLVAAPRRKGHAMEWSEIPNVPLWAEAAVNAERRKLRETPRLWHLSRLVEAKEEGDVTGLG